MNAQRAWVLRARDCGQKTLAVTDAVAQKGQRRTAAQQPAKYIDPKTGVTWSGRGLAPAWLAAAAKDRSKFLIADAGSSDAGSAKVAGKKETAERAAAKKTVATKPTAKKALAKRP
jgi:hypothetical protein